MDVQIEHERLAATRKELRSLRAELAAANARLEAAEWEDAGFCPQCHADELRTSIDVIDAEEKGVVRQVYFCAACGHAWVKVEPVRPEVQS